MDGGGWWATVHGIANSQTQLSDFTFFVSNPATKRGCVMHLDSCTDSHRLVIRALQTPPHHVLWGRTGAQTKRSKQDCL